MTTTRILTLIMAALAVCTNISARDNSAHVTQYDVVWHSPSNDSSESMPVGGGDTGCNVWVENGSLLLYFSRSGSFDENGSLLKNGRVRITTSPNIFDQPTHFRQRLNLRDGVVTIEATKGDRRVSFTIWCDIFSSAIHLKMDSNKPTEVCAAYENWRTDLQPLKGDRRRMTVGTLGYPNQLFDYPDSVNTSQDKVLFFHRNLNDKLFMLEEFKEQQLTDLLPLANDPLSDLTFGGVMRMDNCKDDGMVKGRYMDTPYIAHKLRSKTATKHLNIDIVMLTMQTSTTKEWRDSLSQSLQEAVDKREQRAKENRAWWHEIWSRSYVVINDRAGDTDQGWRIGRNYNLMRYMTACNAYGRYPTKLNGGLFTFDPSKVKAEWAFTPDFRNWGGASHTCQNQRHIYWPLLQSGDYDFFAPQFDLYANTLFINMARCAKLWGHAGACYTEYLNIYGIPGGNTYGWQGSPEKARCRPDDWPVDQLYNQWTVGHYSSQLEFAYMILEWHRWFDCDIRKYMPFIEQATMFFDLHYRQQHLKDSGSELDSNGKLVIYPSSALETYKNALNPTDVVAGLKVIVERLLTLPDSLLGQQSREYWQAFEKRIPPLPVDTLNSRRVIMPARKWSHKQNIEIPQLYVLFPYRIYGVGCDDLQLVVDTWKNGIVTASDRNYISWMQPGIFTARMGLRDEAVDYLKRKMDDSGRRFPAFWGPGHDWVPDHNWGGSGMMQLQDMLMQVVDDNHIALLAAWPKQWDVAFKLAVPHNHTIEAQYKNGKIVKASTDAPETFTITDHSAK